MTSNQTLGMCIADRRIGPGCPTYVIAEACDNHMGNLDHAREMIRLAKLAGCDAIKFQHHLPDEEMLPETPMSSNFSEPLYDFLIRHALTLEQHADLSEYCSSLGIQYLCTPFSYKAAEELTTIGVPAFKIGSGEMSDLPSMSRIATQFGLPMIVSTGMSTYDEIDETYKLLISLGNPFTLMNCVSEYPPDYRDINLGVITKMKLRYPEAVIGHSDHTPDIYTCFAAVALGASIIEKHVILDKRQPGPDQSVSIDFVDLGSLVDGIRKIEDAMGATKIVHEKEKEIRRWALRSLVTIKPIKSGDILSTDNLWSKRPGTGILSRYFDSVIGKRVKTNLPENHLLRWEDLDVGDSN